MLRAILKLWTAIMLGLHLCSYTWMFFWVRWRERMLSAILRLWTAIMLGLVVVEVAAGALRTDTAARLIVSPIKSIILQGVKIIFFYFYVF